MSEPGHARWFSEEVQPHDAALRAYLRARFPDFPDQDDLVQEAYSRLLHARRQGPVTFPRAFLFTTARNAALDFFRRRRISPVAQVTNFDDSRVLDESPNAAELASQHQEFEVLDDAIRSLPERCRQVIMLRYLDGLAYKEIAVRLGISPETVKVHMAKGVRRCAEYFEEHGLVTDPKRPNDQEAGA
jgi:RNA polymerase sigma factor (sigma-70 family)